MMTNVLLLEDEPGHAELVKLSLAKTRGQFRVHHCVRMAEAIQALRTGEFDVVLADLSVPDSRGIETVKKLRRENKTVPVIVLTSLSDDAVAESTLEVGAQDYLVKDTFTSEMLKRSIIYAIQRQQNYTRIERLLRQNRKTKALLERKNRHLARLYKTAHRFVNHVSHEFRTPLTVIKEYVSVIREGLVGEVNPEQGRMLDIVSDRADGLNHMVDDILDSSKLDAGLLGATRVACRIEDIIEGLRPSLERKAELKEVVLSVEVQDGLDDVFCDAEMVGRVIINLVVNAIKFCGTPGEVCLRAGRNLDAHEIVVSVSDNGPGIDSENLEMIFRQFKQVGFNPRGSTDGFGLGLSIAKELVELNLGELGVESELGTGSTFLFSLPISNQQEVMRRYLNWIHRIGNGQCSLSLIVVKIDENTEAQLADDTNSFMNYLLRRHDLLLRLSPHSWLLTLKIDRAELKAFLDRAETTWADANRNRLNGALPKLAFHQMGTTKNCAPIEDYLRRVTEIPGMEPTGSDLILDEPTVLEDEPHLYEAASGEEEFRMEEPPLLEDEDSLDDESLLDEESLMDDELLDEELPLEEESLEEEHSR